MVQETQFVQKLFGDAVDMEPDARRAFLDVACQGVPEVRRLVEELLKKDERAGSFLKRPLVAFSSSDGSTPRTTGTNQSGPAPRFKAGDRIADRFEIIRFIASGGMGEVYEAADDLLQRHHIALKIIREEIAANNEAAHRFVQEVLLARKVVHPNLCPIYEIFRCDEILPPFLFLTMKLLDGETLGSCLRRNTQIPPGETVQIFRQMIAGIAAIHNAGIVHRDIKPTNVMVDRSGAELTLTIMDFGLARNYQADTTLHIPGAIAGTPGYLAPELMMGALPSPASDIYALGVLLHQVLTGERPVDSPDGISKRAAASLKKAPVPETYVAAVREFLSEDPIARCCAFEELRFALEDTGRVLNQRSPVWTRRRMLTSSGAALLGVAAGGAVWKRDQISDLFHPLPLKRFVALMEWPPSRDARIRPMLVNLIDSISSELARAEAFDHNLFLIPHFSSNDVNTPGQLNEVRESLGANLVLAASGIRSPKDLRVSLQVLDPSQSHSIRSKQLHVPLEREIALPQMAVRAAAELLGISRYDPDGKRLEAGTNNPAAFAAFQEAEALRKQPNDTGLEPAIEKYRQAIEVDPRYAIATAQLALAYCRLADVKHDPAAIALARANAETALGMDHNLVPARMALAGALEQSGDEMSALREMKRALAADPTNARTLVWLGQSYAELNRWQSAEESFRRALQLRPNDWIAHNELGRVLYKQGNYLHALLEFRTAALASPKDVLTQSNVGFMYLVLGHTDEALDKLRQSLSLRRTALAASMMSAALRSKHDALSGLPFAREAAALDPLDSNMWLELGDCESMIRGHQGSAIKAYAEAARVQREALEINDADGPGWILLALCESKVGASQDARAHLRKGDSLPSGDIDTQMSKARVLETLGERDKALHVLASCLHRGASTVQVDLMPEMEHLKTDPRYRQILRALPSPRTT